MFTCVGRVRVGGERVLADRGQAVVGVIIWVAVAAALIVGLGRVAVVALDAARAATAADAVALAAVAADDAAGHDAAARNHAVVIRLVRSGDEVQVWVRVGRAEAVARARRELQTNNLVIGPRAEQTTSNYGIHCDRDRNRRSGGRQHVSCRAL